MTLVTWTDNDPTLASTFEAGRIAEYRWNGHLVPFFYGIECERIADLQATTDPTGQQFRWNFNIGDCGGWEYMLPDDDSAPEWNACKTVEIDGVTLYNMGDGWTWRDIEWPLRSEDPERFAEVMGMWIQVSRAQSDTSDMRLMDHAYAYGAF